MLSDSDIWFLTFRSGYTNFSLCLPGQSVDACLAYQNNGVLAHEVFAANEGCDSALCGRLIRKAWVTGVAQ